MIIGNIHGRSFEILVESQNRGVAVGVDFHYHLQRVFWTDAVLDKVNRNFRSIAWELIEPQAQSVDNFLLWGEKREKFLCFLTKKALEIFYVNQHLFPCYTITWEL